MAGALEMSLKQLTDFPIDKYIKIEKLGQGAFGMVYLYTINEEENDEILDLKQLKTVAVKTFGKKHYYDIEMNNLNIFRSQEHPNLVKIHGWCSLGSIFGIGMMYKCMNVLVSFSRSHLNLA